jgi:hypothetical protein
MGMCVLRWRDWRIKRTPCGAVCYCAARRAAAHKLREIGVSITGCPWQGPPARSPPLCQHDYRYHVAKIEHLLNANPWVSRCRLISSISLMHVNPSRVHAFVQISFITQLQNLLLIFLCFLRVVSQLMTHLADPLYGIYCTSIWLVIRSMRLHI